MEDDEHTYGVPYGGENPGTEEDVPAVKSGDGRALIDKVRARRQQLAAERQPLELDIPGYQGLLVAKYKPVEIEQLSTIAGKVEAMARKHNRRAELNGAIDTLLWACIGIQGREAPGAELTPLDEDDPTPMLYDERLLQYLGVQTVPNTARGLVRAVFNNDVAIVSHHNELAEWLADSDREDQEELLGES